MEIRAVFHADAARSIVRRGVLVVGLLVAGTVAPPGSAGDGPAATIWLPPSITAALARNEAPVPLKEYSRLDAESKERTWQFGTRVNEGRTFVTQENPQVRPRPDPGSPPLDIKLAFLTPVQAFAQDRDYFLVAENSPESRPVHPRWLGWLHRDHLQPGLWALKMRRVPMGPQSPGAGGAAPRSLQIIDEPDGLVTKALLVTPLSILVDTRELQRGTENLATLKAPRDKETPSEQRKLSSEQLKLYSWYPVWKTYLNPLEDPPRWWVLLGRDQRVNRLDREFLRRSIIGWVPLKRIIYWPTAICFEVDRRTRADRLLMDYIELGQHRKGLLLNVFCGPDPQNTQAVEDWQSTRAVEGFARGRMSRARAEQSICLVDGEHLDDSEPLYYDSRYPLLDEETGGPDERLGATAGTLEMSAARSRAVKLGLIGPLVDSRGVRYSSTEADRAIQLGREMARGAENIDIVFVVDDTGSMGNYYDAAVNGILMIQEELDKFFADQREKPVLRYKVLRYRDFQDPNPFWESHVKCSDDRKKVIEVLSARHAGPGDGIGGGPLEAVFHGILGAIGGKNQEGEDDVFTKLSTRILVLIGDNGNHSKGDGLHRDREVNDQDEDQGKVEEHHTVDDVVNALLKKRIAFHAIQVDSPNREAAQVFREQMEAIVHRCRGTISVDSKYFYSSERGLNEQNKKQVTDIIVDRIKRCFEINRIYKGIVDRLAQGQPVVDQLPAEFRDRLREVDGRIEQLRTPAISLPEEFLRRYFEGRPVPPSLFKEIKGQAFEAVYAFELHPFSPKDKHRLLRRRFLIDKASTRVMQVLLHQIVDGGHQGALAQTVTDSIGQLFGPGIKGALQSLTPQEALKMVTPFPMENPIWKYPEKWDDPKFLEEHLNHLEAVESILGARLEGKAYTILERDELGRPKKVEKLDASELFWFARNGDKEDEWAYLSGDEVP